MNSHEAALEIAQHLLRRIFADERTGWGGTSHARLNADGSEPAGISLQASMFRAIGQLFLWKLFPFYMRWKARRQRSTPLSGIPKIEYWGVEGDAPRIPQRLSETQAEVLSALAQKETLWTLRTNLWKLFGLPDTAEGLRGFVRQRS